jgi:hypothetical protein
LTRFWSSNVLRGNGTEPPGRDVPDGMLSVILPLGPAGVRGREGAEVVEAVPLIGVLFSLYLGIVVSYPYVSCHCSAKASSRLIVVLRYV